MKVLNNYKEMEEYYNENEKCYVFAEDGVLMDISIKFKLEMPYSIKARDINAWDIKTCDIKARNIKTCDINACDINAHNINACDISARDINACDINANDINARDINYYAICVSYNNIVCKSIVGRRNNAVKFAMDGEVLIGGYKMGNANANGKLSADTCDKNG